jgi:hypothetical protein
MAVYFVTPDAQGLLKAFDAKIAQKEQEGKILRHPGPPDSTRGRRIESEGLRRGDRN